MTVLTDREGRLLEQTQQWMKETQVPDRGPSTLIRVGLILGITGGVLLLALGVTRLTRDVGEGLEIVRQPRTPMAQDDRRPVTGHFGPQVHAVDLDERHFSSVP